MKDSIKNKNEVEINYYNKLKGFLSELKEKGETLSSQKKDNMNEKFNPFFTTNYTLTKESKNIRASFIQGIKQLIEENTILSKEETKAEKETKKLDIKKLNTELDELYQKYKVELEKIEYQIDAIDIMSVSELAFKKKTLPTGFVRLGNKKAITHSQVKGEINFCYDVATQEMNRIKTEYYF